jgi:hypothetical protein
MRQFVQFTVRTRSDAFASWHTLHCIRGEEFNIVSGREVNSDSYPGCEPRSLRYTLLHTDRVRDIQTLCLQTGVVTGFDARLRSTYKRNECVGRVLNWLCVKCM